MNAKHTASRAVYVAAREAYFQLSAIQFPTDAEARALSIAAARLDATYAAYNRARGIK